MLDARRNSVIVAVALWVQQDDIVRKPIDLTDTTASPPITHLNGGSIQLGAGQEDLRTFLVLTQTLQFAGLCHVRVSR